MATAFHRNTMTNTEGGTDDEEFRVAAIKDRADTTVQVWMGLTIGCAKCHSHKFDPITHNEYYRFYAFFNQTADNDQPDESPVIPAPTPEYTEQSAIDVQIADAAGEARQPSAASPPVRPSGSRASGPSERDRPRRSVPRRSWRSSTPRPRSGRKFRPRRWPGHYPYDRAGVEADPRRARRAGEIPADKFPPYR